MISIHALREEGDQPDVSTIANTDWISIHALREEGDLVSVEIEFSHRLFQFTPSVRRATRKLAGLEMNNEYFNPRPP